MNESEAPRAVAAEDGAPRRQTDDQQPEGGTVTGPDSAPGTAPAQGNATPVRPAPRTARRSSQRQARTTRGLIAGAIGLLLLGIAVGRLLSPAGSSRTPAATPVAAPTSAPQVFSPPAGAPLVATVLGATAGLSIPEEAAMLPNGHIAVADLGNKRVAILDSSGHLVASLKTAATPLQAPFALAVTPHALFVLDAGRGAIDRYGIGGRFEHEVIRDAGDLQAGRGMAIASDGAFYVANPRANSVVVISAVGAVERRIAPPLGSLPGQFKQPSDVAVGPGGNIYVLDNENRRIQELTPAGKALAQWATQGSDTVRSVHVLPLANGRILASDPTGALLLYRPKESLPVRLPIQVGTQPAGVVQPLGLALAPHHTVLIADAHGNRLLLVSLPT